MGGSEGGADGGTSEAGAGEAGGPDGGTDGAIESGASEAGSDAGAADASSEAGADAAAEAGSEAGLDGAVQDGSTDGSADAGSDAPPITYVDGGACIAEPDGAACNALAVTGAMITPTCVSGDVPAALGGTILPGEYALTGAAFYDSDGAACSVPETIAVNIVIEGSCMQLSSSSLYGDATTLVTASFSIAVTDAGLSTTPVCASNNSGMMAVDQYTATSTTLTLYSTSVGQSLTFTRQ